MTLIRQGTIIDNMGLESFTQWDGRGWFLLRLDYGWDVPGHPLLTEGGKFPERPGAVDLGLGFGAPGDAVRPNRNRLQVIWGAEALVARCRAISRESALTKNFAAKNGVVLCARFPRSFTLVLAAARRETPLSGWAEMQPLGEIPSIYRRLERDELARYAHLRLEWETGVAHARAASVLPEAAGLMAREGEIRPAALARRLGVTSGAARSYLVWMEEAGLCRRMAGGAYALRHPALSRLFLSEEGEKPRHMPSRRGQRAADWVEID